MINLKGVVKKLNLSRFIIHEKLMCVGIRLIISVTFLLLVVSVRLQAQDTKVSHPFMWKSFNNPAYSGFDGLAGVNIGMQRSYWSKPLDFRSYFVSADYAFQEKRTFGLGGLSLFYQRDQESSVMYVTQLFAAALSARVKLSRSTVLQVGLQPSLYCKSVDPSKLTLGDQFDPFYGQILDISPELMSFYADKVTIFDMAAGIYGQTDFNVAWHGVASGVWVFCISYHRIHSVVFIRTRVCFFRRKSVESPVFGICFVCTSFCFRESDQYSAFSVRNDRCAVGYAEFTIRSLLGGRAFRTDRFGCPGGSIRRIAGRYLVSTFRSEYSGRT